MVKAALVAIVDDDPRIQDLLGAELADLDQEHCSFSSGEQLLATAEAAVLLIQISKLGPQQILDAWIVINDGHQGCLHHTTARP